MRERDGQALEAGREAGRQGVADHVQPGKLAWVEPEGHQSSRGAPRIGSDTLLVVDPSDLAKSHGKKMEHIATVRDGSHGGYKNGYWLCQLIAVECGGHEITPLVNHLWSHAAPGHLPENDELLSCIERVAAHAGKNGVYVMDRVGDRMSIMRELPLQDRRFLIRMVGNRHLAHKGEAVLAEQLAASCPIKHVDHVTKQNPDGTERRVELRYGMRRVWLPDFPGRELRLVVVHGFGEKPLMILTTEPLSGWSKSLWWAIEAYLTRWRIEETLRFAKQTYALEDVRVLGHQSLRNMMALALVAMSFAMLWLGQREKLAVLARHAVRAAKRLFGIPDFRYYAVADVARQLLVPLLGGLGILGMRVRPLRREDAGEAEGGGGHAGAVRPGLARQLAAELGEAVRVIAVGGVVLVHGEVGPVAVALRDAAIEPAHRVDRRRAEEAAHAVLLAREDHVERALRIHGEAPGGVLGLLHVARQVDDRVDALADAAAVVDVEGRAEVARELGVGLGEVLGPALHAPRRPTGRARHRTRRRPPG